MKNLAKYVVLLRNRATGQLYAGSKEWTEDASGAHNFEAVESAIEFARTERLAGMEVVLRHDDPICDLVLPFGPKP